MQTKRFTTAVLLIVCMACVGCGIQNQPENGRETKITRLYGKTVSALLEAKETEAEAADVWAIVALTGNSLADRYEKTESGSFTDYIVSEEGRAEIEAMQLRQQNVMDEISRLGISDEFNHSYTTLLNGFSVYVDTDDIAKIEALAEVDGVYVSEIYAEPQASVADAIKGISDTGILENDTDYKGEGQIIAIIDTGIDVTHTAFASEPGEVRLTRQEVIDVFDSLYIHTKLNKNNLGKKLYVSDKIPFGYDYANKDLTLVGKTADINRRGGYHGTHVAGIAAGNDELVTGSASKAQLAVMKVFRDGSGTAKTDDILGALCDAAAIGADVVNLSLGSAGGFPKEYGSETGEYINSVYRRMEMLGISVCVAAGNDQSASLYYNGGIGNLSDAPDNGIVSSPASYTPNLSVASCYGGGWEYMLVDGKMVIYRPAVSTDGMKYSFVEKLLAGAGKGEFEYVCVPNAGEEADYEGLDITGKIAVVTRGTTSFEEKQKVAAEKGAVACVIVNNQTGNINAQIVDLRIPTCTVSIDYAEIISAAEDKKMSFDADYGYILMSSFSSIGPLPNLDLGVDITAPGHDIYSAVPYSYTSYYGKKGYAYVSGTSMATPNVAGITAAVRQYVKTAHPELTAQEVRSRAYKLMMSTADILMNEEGNPVSPRKQGAGMVNVSSAVAAKAYLEVTGSDRVRLSLGDDKNRDGVYTLNFKVVNTSNIDLYYTFNFMTFTESTDEETDAIREMAYMLEDCGYSVRVRNGEYEGEMLTVEAGETASVKVVVTLSEDAVRYLEETFENGIYVEGFVELEAINDIDISIPWMAYYGDWSDPAVFDGSAYKPETVSFYGNYLVGSYPVLNSYGIPTSIVYDLGAYSFYDLPSGYEAPEASEDKISISNKGSLAAVVVGNLRAIKELKVSVLDPVTQNVYYTATGTNFRRMMLNSFGSPNPLYANLNLEMSEFRFYNNQTLTVRYEAKSFAEGADYQTFDLPLFIDYEAPTLEKAEVVVEDGRTILNMDVYDNHYLLSVQILTYDEEGNLSLAYDYAYPVYDFVKGQTNKISIDISRHMEYLDNGRLAVQFNDYAINSSAYTIEYNAEEGENTDSVKTNGTLVYENKLANNAPANTYDAEKPEFEIDENGVLTQYNGEGGEVVLPETVKEIAYGVFSNNSITKVTVNEGCVKIGSNVFANARNLKEAVLPSTLEYIDYSAFAGAIRLEKINLEDTKVNYYGGNCFMYTALKEITVPSAGTEITMGVNAIAYMPKLTKATVNADVNTLSGIFVGCTKLEEVVLNGKVGLITNYSFCDNAGIKKLVFNNEIGQIGDEYITRIDDYDSPIGSVAKVFCSMSFLEEVVFNSDIGGFYGYAFNANPSLCKVVFGGNVGHFSPYAFQYNQKLTHFELAEGNDNFVYDAETGLLYNKDKTEVYKPGEWDYDGIFEVPETLAELPRLSEASSVCLKVWTELKISDEGCSNNLREWTGDPAGYREELDMPLLKGVIVPEKFTEIPNNFLYCHSGVTSVEIKGAITKIGRNAFAKTSISSFTVPETVKEILHYAFKGCAKLESIEFNDDLEKWGTNNNRFFEEFNGCSSLKEIRIPSVITGFMYKTFGDCTSLERVYLHDNVNYISGFGNFSNCTNLKEIIGGATWSEVPYNTFENCENLVRIDPIGEGLKTIDTKALLNCSKLNIRIPSTVTRINEKAFSGCASMKIVDIPAAVTSIDFADIFAGCTAIKEYNVAEDNAAYSSVDGVVYTKDGETLLVYHLGKEDASFTVASGAEIIGEKAFENARYLKEIFLADVIEIDDGAFANSAVTTVSGDKLAYVGDEAFKDVSTLIGIDLQAAEYIGADAFRNTGLTEALIGQLHRIHRRIRVCGLRFPYDRKSRSERLRIRLSDGIRRLRHRNLQR